LDTSFHASQLRTSGPRRRRRSARAATPTRRSAACWACSSSTKRTTWARSGWCGGWSGASASG